MITFLIQIASLISARAAGWFFLAFVCLACSTAKPGQPEMEGNPDVAIAVVLEQQRRAWNEGNLEGYMQGYWQSDSLAFVGKSGITYGWKQTLENYRRSYPDPEAMGKLTFTVLKLEMTGPSAAYMLGKWHLARQAGDLQGHFSLLWRKINGRWVIVSDHSS